MGHPIHKHMHTHITKQNVKAAIKDDKAHMDYLKRDVKDDQRAGGNTKILIKQLMKSIYLNQQEM